MTQFYLTEAENEYVIRGNSAVMKCKIPSFVADFVQVDAWVGDDGHVHSYSNENYGIRRSGWRLPRHSIVLNSTEADDRLKSMNVTVKRARKYS